MKIRSKEILIALGKGILRQAEANVAALENGNSLTFNIENIAEIYLEELGRLFIKATENEEFVVSDGLANAIAQNCQQTISPQTVQALSAAITPIIQQAFARFQTSCYTRVFFPEDGQRIQEAAQSIGLNVSSSRNLDPVEPFKKTLRDFLNFIKRNGQMLNGDSSGLFHLAIAQIFSFAYASIESSYIPRNFVNDIRASQQAEAQPGVTAEQLNQVRRDVMSAFLEIRGRLIARDEELCRVDTSFAGLAAGLRRGFLSSPSSVGVAAVNDARAAEAISLAYNLHGKSPQRQAELLRQASADAAVTKEQFGMMLRFICDNNSEDLRNAIINSQDRVTRKTALHLVIESKNSDKMNALLHLYGSVSLLIKDHQGLDPLTIAQQNNSPTDVLQFLLQTKRRVENERPRVPLAPELLNNQQYLELGSQFLVGASLAYFAYRFNSRTNYDVYNLICTLIGAAALQTVDNVNFKMVRNFAVASSMGIALLKVIPAWASAILVTNTTLNILYDVHQHRAAAAPRPF